MPDDNDDAVRSRPDALAHLPDDGFEVYSPARAFEGTIESAVEAFLQTHRFGSTPVVVDVASLGPRLYSWAFHAHVEGLVDSTLMNLPGVGTYRVWCRLERDLKPYK